MAKFPPMKTPRGVMGDDGDTDDSGNSGPANSKKVFSRGKKRPPFNFRKKNSSSRGSKGPKGRYGGPPVPVDM